MTTIFILYSPEIIKIMKDRGMSDATIADLRKKSAPAPQNKKN